MKNGKYYDTSENFNKKFTVQDENLDYVTINGERVFPENGEYTLYPKDDIQEITAVDKAGNVSVSRQFTKSQFNVFCTISPSPVSLFIRSKLSVNAL